MVTQIVTDANCHARCDNYCHRDLNVSRVSCHSPRKGGLPPHPPINSETPPTPKLEVGIFAARPPRSRLIFSKSINALQHNFMLDTLAVCFRIDIMHKFLFALVLFVCSLALADSNPFPASVGKSNFSTFTVGTATSIVILPRNSARNFLFVQNQGGVAVVVKPGGVPSNATDGVVLAAGASWQPMPALTDALYGVSASSTAKIVMIEGVK